MNKTQPSNFQVPKKFEAVGGLTKDKDSSTKINGKTNLPNNNININNKLDFLIKANKSPQINLINSKEEIKKNDNFNEIIASQNLAKNKIIPSFLLPKKGGETNLANNLPISSNSHLKMNNFFNNTNKNSMLKTNNTPTNAGGALNFKNNNLFMNSKK